MWPYHQLHSQHLLLAYVFLSLAALTDLSAHGQYLSREERLAKVEKTFGEPPNMKRLAQKDRVWVDVKRHLVVVDGYIAMRQGQLEMFACPAGTKEHESVVGLFTKAQLVHAGLLAAGARTGKPVQWEPKFEPPTGSEIEIHALWFDPQGKKQAIDARKWVRQLGSEDKTLEVNWVFAGSSLWKDPETGEQRYMAESGDLVCLSNFTTATLDVPIQSSQANSGLLFIANTDLIPPETTPVRLVFKVVAPAADKEATATPNSSAKPSPAAAPTTPAATPAATPPAVTPPAATAPAGKTPSSERKPTEAEGAKTSADLLTPAKKR
jgi:hypothetical protein